MSDECGVEMPKYLCNKQVWALKIKRVDINHVGKALLIIADGVYAPIEVSKEYVDKHQPEAGGYYVVYKGGYKSFSPAEPFEEGYNIIKELSFFDRMVQEQSELREKLDKLVAFGDSATFAGLGEVDRKLLQNQSKHMHEYLAVVDHRVSLYTASNSAG